MYLSISPDLQAALADLVTKGRFESAQATVIEGLRLLIAREQLRAEIQLGIDELDCGEWVDEETAFADVDTVIDRIAAERSR